MSRIVQLLASPYIGMWAGPRTVRRRRRRANWSSPLRAGLGIVGDRFFGKQAHRDASEGPR